MNVGDLYPAPWSMKLITSVKKSTWVVVDKDENYVCTPHGETMSECKALGDFIIQSAVNRLPEPDQLPEPMHSLLLEKIGPYTKKELEFGDREFGDAWVVHLSILPYETFIDGQYAKIIDVKRDEDQKLLFLVQHLDDDKKVTGESWLRGDDIDTYVPI